jgi:hypothetical protein
MAPPPAAARAGEARLEHREELFARAAGRLGRELD